MYKAGKNYQEIDENKTNIILEHIKINNRINSNIVYHTLPTKDLSNIYLTMKNIQYSKLEYADLSGSQLVYCDMDMSDMRNITAHHAIFRGCTILHSNLYYAKLKDAEITACDISSSILRRADLTNANMKYTCAYETDFTDATLDVAFPPNNNSFWIELMRQTIDDKQDRKILFADMMTQDYEHLNLAETIYNGYRELWDSWIKHLFWRWPKYCKVHDIPEE